MNKVRKKKLGELDAYDVSPFGGNIISGTVMHPDICAEYLAYVKHLCIKAKYQERFEASKVGEEFKAFQTFVQQAYEYYLLAKNASFQVAPLCYYYSFLNLMKAYLAPGYWQDQRDKFARHGLKPKRNPADKSKSLSDYLIIDDGIFGLAVDDIMESSIRGSYRGEEIDIREAVWYLPALDVEIRELYDRNPRFIPIRLSIKVEDNQCDVELTTNRSWSLAETYSLPEWRLRGISPNLRRSFKSRCPRGNIEWCYRLRDKLRVVDGTIENNRCVVKQIRQLISSLGSFWSHLELRDRNLLLVPYSVKPVLPVELVVLGVMYYLSLLVRYRPYELEKLRNDNPSLVWFYECFMRNSVVTYYQLLCSRLHGKYIEFSY